MQGFFADFFIFGISIQFAEVYLAILTKCILQNGLTLRNEDDYNVTRRYKSERTFAHMSKLTPHTTKREQQAINSKNRIIKGYFELTQKYGIDSFTVTDLCEYLNISVGQFYHYFNSKDDVVYAQQNVFENQINQWHDDYEESDSRTNLMQYFAWYARFHNGVGVDLTRKTMNAHNTALQHPKEDSDLFLGIYTEAFLKEHELTEYYTPEELIRHFNIVCHGVVFDWALHDGDFDLEQEMIHTMNNVIDGILVKTDGKHLFSIEKS